MKRSRFSEEQIIGILKAAETSGNARAVCQEHNISEQTFYRWRRKYEGMDVSEARKLRELERENSELKKMVADLSLDNRMLRCELEKMVSLAEKRRAAEYLQREHGASERRVCAVLALCRSTKRRSPGDADGMLLQRIHELSVKYPRYGYRKIFELLKREGIPVSRERVRLLRRQEGLRVPRKAPKRRRRGSSTEEAHKAEHPNHVWSYDFVSDQTEDGRTLRFLTVIDEYTRCALWIECARSLTSYDVVRVLENLVELYGRPRSIKSDNGSEFVAKKVQEWLEERSIGACYIEPGSPWQNGHNESFNGVLRDGCLNRWLFESPAEARRIVEQWKAEYNTVRPHGALGGLAPSTFFERWEEEKREAA